MLPVRSWQLIDLEELVEALPHADAQRRSSEVRELLGELEPVALRTRRPGHGLPRS